MYHNWVGKLEVLFKHIEEMRVKHIGIDIDIDVCVDMHYSTVHWHKFTRNDHGNITATLVTPDGTVTEGLMPDVAMFLWVAEPIYEVPSLYRVCYHANRVSQAEAEGIDLYLGDAAEVQAGCCA